MSACYIFAVPVAIKAFVLIHWQFYAVDLATNLVVNIICPSHLKQEKRKRPPVFRAIQKCVSCLCMYIYSYV